MPMSYPCSFMVNWNLDTHQRCGKSWTHCTYGACGCCCLSATLPMVSWQWPVVVVTAHDED